jgi:hypothetical protein
MVGSSKIMRNNKAMKHNDFVFGKFLLFWEKLVYFNKYFPFLQIKKIERIFFCYMYG